MKRARDGKGTEVGGKGKAEVRGWEWNLGGSLRNWL